MRSSERTTLVRKILWAVLPVVVLALVGVGLANYFVARGQIEEGIKKEIHSLSTGLAANLEFFFAQHQTDLDAIAEVPALLEYAKNAEYGLDHEAGIFREDIQNYFVRFTERAGHYRSIVYFDAQRKLVAGVKQGKVIDAFDYATTGLGDTIPDKRWISPIQSAGEEKWIRYAAPINDASGARKGVVVLTASLEYVTNAIDRTQLGAHGGAYLVDESGQAVLGKPIVDAEARRETAEIKGVPFDVRVEADPREFLAPLTKLRDLSLGLLVAVGCVVPLFLTAMVRRSTSPIKELISGTQRLAAGELNYRFPLPKIRELSVLAGAFNHMAEKLSRREEQLRNRIRQLTSLRAMESSVIQRLSEEAVLRSCLDAVASGLSFDRTGLYWVDESNREIVGRYVYHTEAMGLTEEAFRKRKVPLGNGDVLNKVLESRQPLLVLDAQAQKGVNAEYVKEAKTREFVMAPICGKDRVFGVITADNLYTSRSLEEGDKEGLQLFANAAGLALDNLALFEKLAGSEARHRLVLDNSPVAILGLTQDHTISTWNRGAEAIFGYTAKEMIGKPIASLFEADPESYQKLVAEVMGSSGGVREYSIASASKVGFPLDLTLSWGGSQKNYADNKEWSVVIRDVTEAKKLQRQLIFSEKLSAVGQLISGIAHELNNPLQAVVGYANIIKDQQATIGEVTREVKHVHANAERCRKIIDNLLLFVRQGEVKKKAVLAQDVVRASLDLLTHKIKKVGKLEIHTDLADEPLFIEANFQQIEQVIVNVVGNACDAMESWTGAREMHIKVVPSPTGNVLVELRDTGPGMPEHIVARIWEPFFTTKGEGRGTGLGLPICRQIVGEHGGELHVKTKPGEGTMFWFELPRKHPEPALAEEAAPTGDAPPKAATAVSGRILLVEDEQAVRELLTDVLSSAGHQVDAAASLAEAREKIGANEYDMISCDLTLDDGTSLELMRTWATLTTRPRPPFLFLSGDILSNAGAPEFAEPNVHSMQKPVDLKELCALVATVLAQSKGVGGSGGAPGAHAA